MEYIKDNWFNRTFNSKNLANYEVFKDNMDKCDLAREKAAIKEEADAYALEAVMKEEAERKEKEEVERKEKERLAKENELQYYCGVYESPDGSVKGNWHKTEVSLNEEIERYRVSKYKRTWYKTAVLPQKFVNDIAKEHNMPIGEALECCNVPS